MIWKYLLILVFLCKGLVAYAESPCVQNTSGHSPYYDELFKDRKLDITIAVGFIQEKENEITIPIIKEILDLYRSYSLDEASLGETISELEREILGCKECEFYESSQGAGYKIFTSTFFHNCKWIKVKLKLIYPEETIKPWQLKAAFIQALKKDDVIIYAGHGRNGMKFPDFGPPLSTEGKVYFKDVYEGDWVGFRHGYFHPKKYQILMLNACDTWEYYRDVLRNNIWEKPAHKLGLILTKGKVLQSTLPRTTTSLIRSLFLKQDATEIIKSLEHTKQTVDKMVGFEDFVGDELFGITTEDSSRIH